MAEDDFKTYSQLISRSHNIATALAASGAKARFRVVVLLEPTFDLIAAILAIWRIGAVYVPLDTTLPEKRLDAMINDCNASTIMISNDTEIIVAGLRIDGRPIVNVSLVDVETLSMIPTIDAEDDAVILYTSGSSGVPKGILLQHEGLRNWMEQVAEMCGLTDHEVVLQQSSTGFDMSVTQIFTALCLGGTIRLVPQPIRGDAQMIVQLIISGGVTFTSATPSEYLSWLKYGQNDNTNHLRRSSWNRALSAGEPVQSSLLDLFASVGKSDLLFFNSYGPTEISLVASATEIRIQSSGQHSRQDITAGYPLPNYSIYVLDEQLRPVPIGMQGEIFVGGAGVSAGYIGNTELTGKKFVANPFCTPHYEHNGWTMMHRTGDLGRWTRQGALLIESRISGDTQIKLRGQRIDLQEIEVALLVASDGVLSEAVVSVWRETTQNSESLVAHVTFNPGRSKEAKGQFLAMLPSMLPLPRYMWPAAIIPLKSLPRSTSGKLDRRAIASFELPQSQRSKETNGEATLTDVEKGLLVEWKAVIPGRILQSHLRIGTETDFFHIGGTSLLLVELQARICSRFGVRPHLIQMFEYSTLGGMSLTISKQEVEVDLIDWRLETMLGPEIMQQPSTIPIDNGTTTKNVVLTGATGFLGTAILHALLQDPDIEKIHCIGVRNAGSRENLISLGSKVKVYDGDLTSRRLALTAKQSAAVFSDASCVIHSGADVSHLKTFQSLRAANLQATKELVEMMLPRRIPIHYISTGGTCTYSGLSEFGEVSTSRFPPPPDAFDGYTSSKWASEQYLEKVHEHCGWPICIHRPSSIIRPDFANLDLMQSLLHYSQLTRSVPLLPNLHGVLELVSLDAVVSRLMREMLEGPRDGRLRFAHESGSVSIELRNLKAAIGEDSDSDIEELPPREWARRAAACGLHELLVAFFENLEDVRAVTYPRLVQSADIRNHASRCG